MISPVVFIDYPVFDSILAYCVYQSKRKIADVKSPSGSEIIDFELPLARHKDFGFYLCSYAMPVPVEGTDFWSKRWDSEHDFIADFKKAKRRVNIASGKSKSFLIPVVTQSFTKLYFYFDGDPDAVSFYIRNYLVGIGKKVAMGFGWYSEFRIDKIEPSANYCLVRPLPLDFLENNLCELAGLSIEQGFGSWKLPYWKAEYQEKILIPKLK